jgi:hypothetical protein
MVQGYQDPYGDSRSSHDESATHHASHHSTRPPPSPPNSWNASSTPSEKGRSALRLSALEFLDRLAAIFSTTPAGFTRSASV